MKKIIIIWWAPATWKTYLAKIFSKKFNCPWISTDFIRDWMKTIVSEKDYPGLFNFANVTAEEHYSNGYDVDKSIELEKKRDEDVFKGVKSFILSNNHWDLFIIEWISIHPKDISELKTLDIEIIPFFLLDNDKKRIKDILYTRGLWDKADKYEDWVKEKELEYLIKTNKYYQKELKKFDLPYFEISSDRDKTINEIMDYLNKLI